MNTTDTIVAPATPYGVGGLAVVRLSGPDTLSVFSSLYSGANSLQPRQATLTLLKNAQGDVFEEAITTRFVAPHSYTGEDLVEISCHGNPVIIQLIIDRCQRSGARLADPGEFTRRAFLHGKLDLIQAESVATLIHSQSAESTALNFRLLRGKLSERLTSIKEALIAAMGIVEYELDISEDLPDKTLFLRLHNSVMKILDDTKRLRDSYQQGRLLTDGALVVIAGETNVGKSTLLNRLSDSDRAITSQTPGTTRDPIDIALILEGVPVRLIDTAGLRTASEEIEQEGIRRTHRYLRAADLVLLLGDQVRPDLSGLPPLENENIPVIPVVNKIDLIDNQTPASEPDNSGSDCLYISAKTGAGIDVLRRGIKEKLGVSQALSANVALTTARQQKGLQHCSHHLALARELIEPANASTENPSVPYELVAVELREALNGIDELLGKTTPDDILNSLFQNFCVGK